MALIQCPECTNEVSSFAVMCLRCGFPIRDAITGEEESLLSVSPRMFDGNWIVLLLVLALSVGVVGLPVLIWEWLRVLSTRLTVTNHRSVLRMGLLERRTNEVRHVDIRNVRVSQGAIQRMFGVGTLEIASAGLGDVEIKVKGIAKPDAVAKVIWSHRQGRVHD